MSQIDAADGSFTGTSVPWMWALFSSEIVAAHESLRGT